ncbi:MAG: DUF3526 domain-containing protein [Pseudomonadota bacterium]
MITINDLLREARFLSQQRATLLLILFAGLCAVFAVWSGLAEISTQRTTIERLITADELDRHNALHTQPDYGSAAYYSFHLTYDPPSTLAFAALGERDVRPWKHRIRMLALEGQIYETDTANPELALAGRFDFAFVVSVLAPRFVILLLHDLYAAERVAGRHALLIVTSAHDQRLWWTRACVRIGALALCLLIPLWAGGLIGGASVLSLLLISLIVIAHLLIWSVLCLWLARQNASAPVIASWLLGIWLALAIILPVAALTMINQAIASPKGGDIIMLQRETVNDAWDLPKEATMTAFLAQHPAWQDYAKINQPFEWKWYYAFQQVGDQVAAPMSQTYRDALAQRDSVAGYAALLSPPALVQRSLSRLAETDIQAALGYEQRVRDFHQTLRLFYYPLLFKDGAYEASVLEDLPKFQANRESAL